jgi:hypothetical protein
MKALHSFSYSHDGITLKRIDKGADASALPADLLPGLIAEGFVSDRLAPDQGLDEREIHADLEALGVAVDPAASRTEKLAQRAASRAERDTKQAA